LGSFCFAVLRSTLEVIFGVNSKLRQVAHSHGPSANAAGRCCRL
jgi:hypothetical protein